MSLRAIAATIAALAAGVLLGAELMGWHWRARYLRLLSIHERWIARAAEHAWPLRT